MYRSERTNGSHVDSNEKRQIKTTIVQNVATGNAGKVAEQAATSGSRNGDR